MTIKIIFLINTLGGGGAEKVLVNLVNNMDCSKFDITIETMFDDGVNASLLKPEINYINKKAFCPKGIAYLYKFLSSKQLYKFFIGEEKYDILVAFMHGAPVKVISGCPNNGTKKIAWLHNGNPKTGTFFKFWLKKRNAIEAYKRMDAIAAVSNAVSDAFSNYTGIGDIVTVYNTNDVKMIFELAKKNNSNKNESLEIVSVGRISHEKGYIRFFNVCKKLKKEISNIRVTVIGSGAEEVSLKNLIDENNAEEWFKLIGYKSNPYSFIVDADLFVCPSYVEGLSTATTEAIILGLPVVSTDVSGAKEILGEKNEYGIVVENSEDGLYDGMKKMLQDDKLRLHYKNKARERAEFFNPANTVKQAEDLFESVIKKSF